jgi:8-oxo-dGTP pyrophosphatase MutT (NUDIX family)
MRDGTGGICNPLKWNFFGGSIADDEEPIDGAMRETSEELGIEVNRDDFELLGELHPSEDKLVYVVKYKKPLGWKDIEIREGAGAGYFTRDELLKIDITDATRLLIEKYLLIQE